MSEYHQEIYELLHRDANFDRGYPDQRPLLAHYTSVAVLEKILENKEVWYSHPLNMNDSQEMRHGLILGRRAIREHEGLKKSCLNADNHINFVAHFESLFQQFVDEHLLDTYVLCFSLHDRSDFDGRLSMWRAYGANGNGVALVIDTAMMEPQMNSPIRLYPVEYSSEQDRVSWINRSLSLVADSLSEQTVTDSILHQAAWAWFHRLKLFALLSKHKGFKEEDEWRAVFIPHDGNKEAIKELLGYSVTERGVEPKLRMKIEPTQNLTSADVFLSNITDRIILGPTQNSELAKASVQRMLELQGYPELKERVSSSTIPFRPR